MSELSAIEQLYTGLDRLGPGEVSDVSWALSHLKLPENARALDAGCGSGADIAPLLAAGVCHVTAIDKSAVFTEQARARHTGDNRVSVHCGDMLEPKGPFDLIWSAGAVYFLGIGPALEAFRQRLAPGGAVVFSELCWFTDNPSPDVLDFWKEHTAMTDEAGVSDQITAAGYEIIAQIRLSGAAWEGYFLPLEARIQKLEANAGTEMLAVLDESRREIELMRARRSELGYLMNVVRPV